ncbi:hypothetical protein ACFQJD_18340 [Haloplanus sp. GCM10025708]|uniref:hypothetical protein n=1 Tax=Haloplanus sp. GCM10025708 TaxID=3252679 RepID=UPI0036160F6D
MGIVRRVLRLRDREVAGGAVRPVRGRGVSRPVERKGERVRRGRVVAAGVDGDERELAVGDGDAEGVGS